MEYALDNISLAPHPTARTQAAASRPLRAGAIVLVAPALTTALIPSQKGERCDHCHLAPVEGRRLSKCTGCAAFWYCGTACQTKQWNAHHRKICKRYNRYLASSECQAMAPEQRTDALLLSQLLLAVFPKDEFDIAAAARRSDAVAQFFDLLKGPAQPDSAARVPLCRPPGAAAAPQNVVDEAFARFGNNNFVVQSHLNAYAHGVFPLASRVFNHSCVPNCVPKYTITPTEPVTMEIVALRDVDPGEELTLPYLDPALPFDIRQRALQESYGFTCTCALCTFQRAASPLPPLPASPAALAAAERTLCTFISAHVLPLDPSAPPVNPGADAFTSLPPDALPLLGARYLPALSERFSAAAHAGPCAAALPPGRTLLALYAALYPRNYPQIGLHALELAKTAWNALVAAERGGDASRSETQELEDAARHYLALAARVLATYGPEGDAGGPLEEVRVLRELLA